MAFLGVQKLLDEPQDLSGKDATGGLSPPVTALWCGILSASSLVLGGVFGIWRHPVNEHVVARLMAFGGGALLFAVTIELYGGTLHEIEKYGAKYGETPDLVHEVQEHQQLGDKLFVTYCKMGSCLLACLLGAWLYMMFFYRKLEAYAGVEKGQEEDDSPRKSIFKHAAEEHTAKRVTNVFKARVAKRKEEELKNDPVAAAAAAKKAEEEAEKQKAEEEEAKLEKKRSAAIAIMAGVCVDGVAEGILFGFMAAHHNLSLDFIFSVFVSNFPEAYSVSSMLKELKRPNWEIMLLWTCFTCLTGFVAWCTAYNLEFFDLHGLAAQLGTGMVEGLAAGAMMMRIIAIMVPEAFEVEGDCSAMCMIFGFIVSITMTVSAGYVDHIGQPRCKMTRQNVKGDGIRGRVEVMDCD